MGGNKGKQTLADFVYPTQSAQVSNYCTYTQLIQEEKWK